MDCRATLLVTRFKRRFVWFEALMLGQQGSVDIDDLAFPFGDEIGRDNLHEASKRNRINVMLTKKIIQFFPIACAQLFRI